ncbi:MAG TPA: FtsK/SpoIIIE domain-containing protein [Baekduia sp.]|jgi:S-DNA-T family DNA segregation ATPase FtsK/SpoIIIE|nr:FtsK/SpoIIIE domain-containing protein [Baekduia sp.]
MTLVEPLRSASVELVLTACHGEHTAEDVRVELSHETPIGVLAAALAQHVGVVDPFADTDLALFCHRSGWLENDATVADADLRAGDRVEITAGRSFGRPPAGAGATAPGQSLVDLVITGGPDAGRRVPLLAGRYVVGRDGTSDIAIADPSISRNHLVLEVRGGRATVTDSGSRNGTAVEGVALAPRTARPLADGEQVEIGRTLLTIAPHAPRTVDGLTGPDATILFNRPPRVARPYEAPSFALSTPPSEAQRAKIPMGAALLPLAMGVAFALLVHQIAMLLFAVLSPVMIVWNAVADRRSGRSAFVRAAKTFREEVARTSEELAAARRLEVAERRRCAPDAGELVSRALGRLPTLWERRRADTDFLTLRLGTADQPSVIGVELPDGGGAELRAEAEPLAAPAAVPAVPAVADLAEGGTLGIWGARDRGTLLARWLLIQTATLRSPREVLVGACVAGEDEGDWSWLKWLPHVDGEALGVDGSLLSARDAESRGLLQELATVVRERTATMRERFGARVQDLGPAVVMLIDDRVGLDRAQVATVLEDGPAAGVHVIWLGQHERELPGGLGLLAKLSSEVARLDLVDVASGATIADVAAEGMDRDLADDVARALAPMRDIGATGTRSDIPKRVALPALLGISEGAAGEVLARWSRADGRLATPVGVAAGTPLTVDLRHDGPHALIAGTTGAGKSELLQSLIVGLAATLPPDRLTFLLIDYKGGAAFKEFAQMPHAVGMVTDLDEHLTHRALISLNAELKRREAVLAAAGAADLREMERRDPAGAPPSLVIVIDEFATLAKEVPAFVDGVVDVAQRGRSLGVHLVLATQRPGGVVSENIRANTNLRIALRVASDQDSEDVIGARDAGRIPRSLPGRGLARTGHEELTAFQAAYAGGHSLVAATAPAVMVRPFGFRAEPSAGASAGAAAAPPADEESDVRVLVRAIAAATEAAGISPPRAPWLPALAPVVDLESLDAAAERRASDAVAVCGLVDDPGHQRQEPLELDLAHTGSLLVYGASGAGKTAALRTIGASLALHASPRELTLYGLDCASRALAGIDALPHCGGVVTVEDEDRVRRLLLLLRREIDERQALLGRRGAFTLEDLRRLAPEEAPPRIVLLLDSYGGFTAAYERVDGGELVDLLPRLIADGRAAGVHVIATADRRNAVPPAVSSIIPWRLVLRMAEEDEYAALGLDARLTRGATLPPGRGFVRDKEMQLALVGADTSAEGQAAGMAALAQRLHDEHGDARAPRLRQLPPVVARTELVQNSGPWTAVLGVDEQRLDVITASAVDAHLVVAGPYRSGRSTALETITLGMRETTPGLRCCLVAPRRSPLTDLGWWDDIARGEEATNVLLQRLVDALDAGVDAPTLLVLDDANELAETSADQLLNVLVRRSRDSDLRVAGAFESTSLRTGWQPWIKDFKKAGQGLLLDPNQDLDGEILGVRLPRRTSATFPPGRGYAVIAGTPTLIQTAS